MTTRHVPVCTFTGASLFPLHPMAAEIRIEDIAHHLSILNRFAGATRVPYSVAQHSVLLSYCCEPQDALHGLLDDAPEAYLGDWIRPVKWLGMMDAMVAVEDALRVFVFGVFGLTPQRPASVAEMDDRLGITEAQDLYAPEAVPAWARAGNRLALNGAPIVPWPADQAEAQFLARFEYLSARGGKA